MSNVKRKSAIRCCYYRAQLKKAVKERNVKIEKKMRENLGAELKGEGKKGEAIQHYTKALKLNDGKESKLPILKILVELHSEEGNQDEMMKYLKEYGKAAKTAGEKQQCEYTGALCHLELYKQKETRSLIDEAKTRAENARKILDENKGKMKKNARQKEGNLSELQAEIHGILGEEKEAEKYLKSALSLGRDEWILAKIEYNFLWSNGVKVAEKLLKLAKTEWERIEANNLIVKAHFGLESINEGIEALHKSLPLLKNGSEEDMKEWERLALLGYKARALNQRLETSEKDRDRNMQYKCEDQLGDIFAKGGVLVIAMKHYEEALRLSSSDSERISSLTSLAVTAADLGRLDDSAKYYEKLKEVEECAGKSTTETEVELFKIGLTSGTIDSDEKIKDHIEKLKKKKDNKFMRVVYCYTSAFYKKLNRTTEMNKYTRLRDACIQPKAVDEPVSKFDDMDDEKILRKFKREPYVLAARKKEMVKVNLKNRVRDEEEIMSEAARKGDLDEIIRLANQGFNLNKANDDGWTALSEAIAYDQEEMVDFLLEKRVNPNCSSKIGWAKSDFGGGLTPLHEASYAGKVSIVEKLLRAGADVTAANEDGWRAADFLKQFIESKSTSLNEKDLDKCIKLLETLKEEERKEGLVRLVDPKHPEKQERGKKTSGTVEKNFTQGPSKNEAQPVDGVRKRGATGGKEKGIEKKQRVAVESTDNGRGEGIQENHDFPFSGVDAPTGGVNGGGQNGQSTVENGNEVLVKVMKLKKEIDELDESRTKAISNAPDAFNGGMDEGGKENEKEKEEERKNGVQRGIPPAPAGGNSMSFENVKREDDDDSDIMIIDPPSLDVKKVNKAPITAKIEDVNKVLVRVLIYDEDVQRKSVLIDAECNTPVCDLPFHSDLKKHIENEKCEWICGRDEIETVTIGRLCEITDSRPIELICVIKT